MIIFVGTCIILMQTIKMVGYIKQPKRIIIALLDILNTTIAVYHHHIASKLHSLKL